MRKQQGFTLIELLVVVAILGVIAAVVGLNITGFFGSGGVTSANVELHQVKTAITAYLADDTVTSFNATIGPNSNYPVNATMAEGVHKYIDGVLQADYTVVNAAVTNATPVEGSKWRNLHFCGGVWQVDPCS